MKTITIQEAQEILTDMLRNIARIAEEEDLEYFVMDGTLLGTIRHKGPIPWDLDIDLYVPDNHLEHFLNTLNEKLPEKYWINYRSDTRNMIPFPRIGLRGYRTDFPHVDVYRMIAIADDEKEEERLRKRARFWSKICEIKTLDIDYYYSHNMRRRIQAKLIKLITAPIPIEKVALKMDAPVNHFTLGETRNVARAFRKKKKNKYPIEYFRDYILMPYCDFEVRVPIEYDKILKVPYGDYMKLPPLEEQNQYYNKTLFIKEIGE